MRSTAAEGGLTHRQLIPLRCASEGEVNADLARHGYLWDGSDPDSVLVRAPRDAGNATDRTMQVYNVRTRMALVIEDDSVAEQFCDEMLRTNVAVLDSIPPGECSP